MRFFLSLASGAALAAMSTLVIADTVTIPPSADACLFELNSNFNFGADTTVPAGALGTMAGGTRARALFRFDIAGAIPEGSTITAVSLALRVTAVPTEAANSTFELYSVFQDWGEGQGTSSQLGGLAAVPGEVTWDSRFHGSASWDEPGGEIGGDFAEDPAAARVVAGIGEYFFDFNATGVAEAQNMLDLPSGNFGWALISASENIPFTARRWATRENAMPPQLTITFTPPPVVAVATPRIVSFTRDDGAGMTVIEFTRDAGLVHKLEYKLSLDAPMWEIVGELPPIVQSSVGVFTFEKSVEDEGFWRVFAALPESP